MLFWKTDNKTTVLHVNEPDDVGSRAEQELRLVFIAPQTDQSFCGPHQASTVLCTALQTD